jgi:hypothetical protein
MEDLFEEKFENAILSYPDKQEFRFVKAMRKIAKITEDSISSRKYGKFHPQTENELTEALEICKDYEMDCDAVLNLEKYVFKAKQSKIITYDCPKWEKFPEKIGRYLDNLPERGFVYIAWRTNPLSVYYVGKTEAYGGERILKLSKHVSLSVAIERGSTLFTIIFPDKNDNIGSVEGSFIRMIKKLGKGDDMLNKKDEPFDPWDGGELSELEKFFEKMTNKVKSYSE